MQVVSSLPMEFTWDSQGIRIDKTLTAYDEFALAFIELLEQEGVRYVLLSGYVALLFGRSRQTEDIDLVIEDLDTQRFRELWARLDKRFECLNTNDCDTALNEYLRDATAIRFSWPGRYLPNMEVKFVHQPLEQEALDHRLRVTLNDRHLFISPIELQIAFKLFLGSEKDIEDAVHLYILFKEHPNRGVLDAYVKDLNQAEQARRYLGD
jgi:hypothetical protein